MRSGQGEASELKMVKVHSKPVVHTVALLAGCGEAGGNVRRILGGLEVPAMT